MANPKKKKKTKKDTGFEYKRLEYSDPPAIKPLPEENIEAVIVEESAATMYGYPAQMQSKSTPLHKKGKMSPSYKTGGPFEGEFKLDEGEKGEGFLETKKGLGSIGFSLKNPFKKKIKTDRKVPNKF